MKNFVVDLKNVALSAISSMFVMIGSLIVLPGRLMSWIGSKLAGFGVYIATFVKDDEKEVDIL